MLSPRENSVKNAPVRDRSGISVFIFRLFRPGSHKTFMSAVLARRFGLLLINFVRGPAIVSIAPPPFFVRRQ